MKNTVTTLLALLLAPGIALAGKPIQSPVYALSSNLDKKPKATDENGKTGVDGAHQGLALGATSIANNGSTALGDTAHSEAKYGLAIGTLTKVEPNATSSVALGFKSEAKEKNVVSVGNDNFQRKIVNMAKGAISTNSFEAVNGSQLFNTNQKVDKNTADIAKNTGDINHLNTSVQKNAGDITNITEGKAGILQLSPDGS
ncbi:hypothetical protein L3561_005904, partial [Pseudomonas aeruginosa]|nr:hypothetical protein [Pseudomonas aeruginosa]